MGRIRSYSAFRDKYVEDDPHDYSKFLFEAKARLKDKLVDLKRQSKDHPKIDDTLKSLAFVRTEISSLYFESTGL